MHFLIIWHCKNQNERTRLLATGAGGGGGTVELVAFGDAFALQNKKNQMKISSERNVKIIAKFNVLIQNNFKKLLKRQCCCIRCRRFDALLFGE